MKATPPTGCCIRCERAVVDLAGVDFKCANPNCQCHKSDKEQIIRRTMNQIKDNLELSSKTMYSASPLQTIIETGLKEFDLLWGIAPPDTLKGKKGADIKDFIRQFAERVAAAATEAERITKNGQIQEQVRRKDERGKIQFELGREAERREILEALPKAFGWDVFPKRDDIEGTPEEEVGYDTALSEITRIIQSRSQVSPEELRKTLGEPLLARELYEDENT